MKKNDISFELLESDEVSTSESSEETEKDTMYSSRTSFISVDEKKKNRIIWFSPDQKQLVFNGYIYGMTGRQNIDESQRWRSGQCAGCGLKTLDGYMYEKPEEKSKYK